SGMVVTSPSRYAVATHWTLESEALKSRARLSRATLTIVVSTLDRIPPSVTTPAIVQVLLSMGPFSMQGEPGRARVLRHRLPAPPPAVGGWRRPGAGRSARARRGRDPV